MSSHNIWDFSNYDNEALESTGESFSYGIPGFSFSPTQQMRLLGFFVVSIREMAHVVDAISMSDYVSFHSLHEFVEHMEQRVLVDNARPPFSDPSSMRTPRRRTRRRNPRSFMTARHLLFLETLEVEPYTDSEDEYEIEDLTELCSYMDMDGTPQNILDDLEIERK